MLVGWAACTVPLFLFCKFLLKSTWYGTFLAILLLRVSSQNYHSVISFSTVTSRRGGGQYITTLVTGTVRARLTSLYSAGYRVPVTLENIAYRSVPWTIKQTYLQFEIPGRTSSYFTGAISSCGFTGTVPYRMLDFKIVFIHVYKVPVPYPLLLFRVGFNADPDPAFYLDVHPRSVSTVTIQCAKPMRTRILGQTGFLEKVEVLHEK